MVISEASILVVEDNIQTRKLVEYWLSRHFTITVAANAEEALALVEWQHFDLFLLDIHLGGGLTGLELLTVLRRSPAYAHTPAIAFTAYALTHERDHLMASGFDIFLCKPFTEQEIVSAINKGLSLGYSLCS